MSARALALAHIKDIRPQRNEQKAWPISCGSVASGTGSSEGYNTQLGELQASMQLPTARAADAGERSITMNFDVDDSSLI